MNNDFSFVHANGMALDSTDPEVNYLYVADPLPRDVSVFLVPKTLNGIKETKLKSSVKHVKIIKFPDAIDNLEFDEITKKLYIGTLPFMNSFLARVMDYNSSVPGSLFVYDTLNETAVPRRVMYHSGKFLKQLAICLYADEKTVFCGGPHDPVILVCEV